MRLKMLQHIRKILFTAIQVSFPKGNPKQKLSRLIYAESLETLFKSLDIQIVLDVGANCGQYHDFLRDHIGYKDLIVSFEPIKELSTQLRHRSKKDNCWIIYDIALGSTDCTVNFNVMKRDVLSSFYRPRNLEIACKGNIVDHVELVSMKRLDNILSELGHIRNLERMFLKLDTQGHDLEVLKGISDFSPISAIQSEVSVLPLYYNIPSIVETLCFFTDIGFQLAAMHPVNYDSLNRVVEFDCLFIKKEGTQSAILI